MPQVFYSLTQSDRTLPRVHRQLLFRVLCSPIPLSNLGCPLTRCVLPCSRKRVSYRPTYSHNPRAHRVRFNSCSPSGERRRWRVDMNTLNRFNSRSPCGERRWLFIIFIYFIIVSTHAPRAGSDSGSSMMPGSSVVSTHAPRVGSDQIRITANVYSHKRHLQRNGVYAAAKRGGFPNYFSFVRAEFALAFSFRIRYFVTHDLQWE